MPCSVFELSHPETSSILLAKCIQFFTISRLFFAFGEELRPEACSARSDYSLCPAEWLIQPTGLERDIY